MNRREILGEGLRKITGTGAAGAKPAGADPPLLNRRDLLKTAALIVGSEILGITDNPVYASYRTQYLNFHITDLEKEMVTHNDINDARCYFWAFVEDRFPADVPGPIIFTTYGDTIYISVTNDLDEPHAFYIPGMYDTGPIAPGQTVTGSFRVSKTGTLLYYDNLNAPVNRVMGLHGALIVMPRYAPRGHKYTPYHNPTPAVQRLFDDLGTKEWWPGVPWEATDYAPYRQYVWLLHQASTRMFAEVGNLPPGAIYPAEQFMDAFLRDPFSPTGENRIAEYFTLNGQCGDFSHSHPAICPNGRVGEPCIIRILNAGLWTHSTHIHANHVYVIAVNGKPQKNILWVDTFTAHAGDTYDWLVPFMRPPDIPNQRGIGRADPGLMCLANPKIPGSVPHPAWPPTEELNTWIPAPGQRMATDINGQPVDLAVQLSPLCYPMHDHSEPSQTAQGGNYNCGLISGINFCGDYNAPGGPTDFPNKPTVYGVYDTAPCAGDDDVHH